LDLCQENDSKNKTRSTSSRRQRSNQHAQTSQTTKGKYKFRYDARKRIVFDQLKRIALEGRLRRTRTIVRKLSVVTALVTVVQFISSSLISSVSYYILVHLFESRGRYREFYTVRDLMEAHRLFYVTLISSVTTVPVTSFNAITVYDQSKHSENMRTLITDTISRSERTFMRLTRLGPTRVDNNPEWTNDPFLDRDRRHGALSTAGHVATKSELIGLLELNLLAVVVRYRLFVAECRLALRPVQFNSMAPLTLI
jgi:hypothetical protein